MPNALRQARRATDAGINSRRNPASPARSCWAVWSSPEKNGSQHDTATRRRSASGNKPRGQLLFPASPQRDRAEPPKCDQDNHGGNETHEELDDQSDCLRRSEDRRCNHRHHRCRKKSFPYSCAHNVIWFTEAQRRASPTAAEEADGAQA